MEHICMKPKHKKIKLSHFKNLSTLLRTNTIKLLL